MENSELKQTIFRLLCEEYGDNEDVEVTLIDGELIVNDEDGDEHTITVEVED